MKKVIWCAKLITASLIGLLVFWVLAFIIVTASSKGVYTIGTIIEYTAASRRPCGKSRGMEIFCGDDARAVVQFDDGSRHTASGVATGGLTESDVGSRRWVFVYIMPVVNAISVIHISSENLE